MKTVYTFDKFVTEMAKGFMDVYKKRYNPEETGYGGPEKWKDAFDYRMGREEAQTILGKKDPYLILGVPKTADKYEIKKAWQKLVKQFHPDMNPGREKEVEEIFKEIQAAYEMLRKD